MKFNGSGFWLIMGLVVGGAGGYYFGMKLAASVDRGADLKQAMRKLWADHVIWTRCYIISALDDAPDANAAAKRLLQNQVDIGNSIVPFYGEDAGKKLANLLKEHILVAVDLIKAAKEDDKDTFKEVDLKWHKNADDIATFLSQANSNWTFEDLQKMLYEHLAVTTKEVSLRLAKDWEADVANFDAVFDQALHMADDLTVGIVKQFPGKF